MKLNTYLEKYRFGIKLLNILVAINFILTLTFVLILSEPWTDRIINYTIPSAIMTSVFSLMVVYWKVKEEIIASKMIDLEEEGSKVTPVVILLGLLIFIVAYPYSEFDSFGIIITLPWLVYLIGIFFGMLMVEIVKDYKK